MKGRKIAPLSVSSLNFAAHTSYQASYSGRYGITAALYTKGISSFMGAIGHCEDKSQKTREEPPVIADITDLMLRAQTIHSSPGQ
ncbi:hypothetical protein RRG08_004141 [Elysia crispata]|uniref:Uncharacterized protein n=1 Tax=Elysia crispata TaxID=231223 RepID=A0AAE0YWQ0_9GAST|nr:hypothetical protein RRG08_004141 [Elysia crispata]